MLKRIASSVVLAILLATLAPASARRQDAGAPTPAEQQREITDKKAVALLGEAAATAQTLKLPENRVAVEMRVAELLWPRDETRARALFREAMASVGEILGEAGDDAAFDEESDAATRFNAALETRREMLSTIAQQSSTVIAAGTSVAVCFPFFIAASMIGTWNSHGVAL